jgi:hypothetical protein
MPIVMGRPVSMGPTSIVITPLDGD